MDIKIAFFYKEVKEDIYIKQPLGFDDTKLGIIYKLNKALYNFKQSL